MDFPVSALEIENDKREVGLLSKVQHANLHNWSLQTSEDVS